jgi:protein-tyrosine-phosphatase
VLLAAGASGGKRLFDGVELTAHYFFDAISARFAESLTYKKVEAAGAVADVPGVEDDIRQAADRIMDAERNKPSLVFVSEKDACRSQIAAAYAKMAAKGRIRVLSAGIDPAEDIHAETHAFLAGEGIDIKYRLPRRLDNLMADEFREQQPFLVVSMVSDGGSVPAAETRYWDLENPRDDEIAFVGNEIRKRVDTLLSAFQDGHPEE